MADNEVWEMAKLSGGIGEATVFPLLSMPVWCWRTGKGFCHRWQDVEYKAAQGKKVDADVVISFDACEASADGERQRCPMLEGIENAAAGKQLHEIKTNIAAYDKSIKEDSNRTQNLFIELVQSQYWYLKNIIKEELDPLEGSGKKLPYRKGIGWWKKREYAFERGITQYDKADWYHFYQPLDAWERLKVARDKDGNLLYPDLKRPTGCEANYSRATDEEIEEWVNDLDMINVENDTGKDAILITQIPVEVCISVPRDVLQCLVDDIECWGEPRHIFTDYADAKEHGKNVGDMYIDISQRAYFDKGKGLLRGYKIPIKDVIPCYNMGTGREQRETEGKEGVLVNLVGEYVRWIRTDEKPHRIKGIIPKWAIYYTPARLTGLWGEKVNWQAFKNPHEAGTWVPCEIKSFIEGLKKYGATGDV